ncbi:MAG: type I DNA topoisomerase [Bacteroidetes bacterium]|nr:type I DNA topoisomerase [Bacteroidota bacterium]
MSKNLVIVESPAKAKTIEGYLGKDFTVKSSYGHVRDLVKSGMGINVKKNFEPVYEISPDKQHVINDLKKLSKKADIVWLATDEDREGEAISWHLLEALELDEKNTRRIVFHEITKKAILNAIDNPRKIDRNLVDAQQARRVLDRLVGFELSPVLWKKVRPSLSAGRVQSVAVRLIVDREREVTSFGITTYYRVTAVFSVNGKTFKTELSKKFTTREEAEKFLNDCIGANFSVRNLEVKPGKRSPAAPFTTSTLQQEASRKLGYSVAQTMVIAQKLYESGKITYMRTDSVNLSQDALANARQVVLSNYGERYSETRQYKTKQASAQEAHEAIRPTDFNTEVVDEDTRNQRLYDLIRKRALASQMSEAILEKTVITVASDKSALNFIGTGEVIKFDGFLRLYMEGTDEEGDETQEGLMPEVTIGEKLALVESVAMQRFTYPPARYTEASLVKKLEELGIGRPSTYAPTISTVQKRGYVVKEERMGREREYDVITLRDNQIKAEKKTETTGADKNKLFPTDIGMLVNDFLVANFKEILDFNFTAFVEKEFDDIANGDLKWQKMLAEFYVPFHKTVEHTTENSERVSGERILGKDPASGLTLLVRVGRFGPMAQIGTTDEIEKLGEGAKARYAKLRNNQRIENITLEEAIDLFKLPRNIGQYEGDDVVVSIGRFGPYVRFGSLFASLKKEDDPYTITYDRAVELIIDKKRANAERLIQSFEEDKEVQVLKGRWGPFINFHGRNLRIPKDKDGTTITLAEINEIAANTPDTGKKSWGGKKGGFKQKAAAPVKKSAGKKKVTEEEPPLKKAASAKKTAVKKKAVKTKKAVKK